MERAAGLSIFLGAAVAEIVGCYAFWAWARLGKSPLQVALAWCLHQDFRVIPLIGPLALGELEESLGALDIALTPDEVRWLAAV